MDWDMDIDWGLIVGVAIVVAALVGLVIWAIVRGQLRKVTTGAEALVGKVAVAQTSLDPKGTVLVEGEHWTAKVNSGKVEPGEEVIVTEIEGLKLVVTKKKTKGRK
jgi:membrane-bound serine protease (ClpP class)